MHSPATHEVQIRLALPSELTQLESLQRRASLNNPGDREALLANPDAIQIPLSQIEAGQVFVAEQAAKVVVFAAILPRPDGDTKLDGLFVEPANWRQGHGIRLVSYCAQVAKAQGAKALHVLGNPHAERFYRQCGFVTMGTQSTAFGPGLMMQKRL